MGIPHLKKKKKKKKITIVHVINMFPNFICPRNFLPWTHLIRVGKKKVFIVQAVQSFPHLYQIPWPKIFLSVITIIFMKPSKQRYVFMHKLNIKDASELTTDKNLPKSQLKFKHFFDF